MEFDRCSHAIFYFFSKYLKIFNHKIKKIQADGCMLNVIVFYFCHIHDRLCLIKFYLSLIGVYSFLGSTALYAGRIIRLPFVNSSIRCADHPTIRAIANNGVYN